MFSFLSWGLQKLHKEMLANQEESQCRSIETWGNVGYKHSGDVNMQVNAQLSSAFTFTVGEMGAKL